MGSLYVYNTQLSLVLHSSKIYVCIFYLIHFIYFLLYYIHSLITNEKLFNVVI